MVTPSPDERLVLDVLWAWVKWWLWQGCLFPVALESEHTSESSREPIEMQICRTHSQKLWFRRCGVGPGRLYCKQVPGWLVPVAQQCPLWATVLWPGQELEFLSLDRAACWCHSSASSMISAWTFLFNLFFAPTFCWFVSLFVFFLCSFFFFWMWAISMQVLDFFFFLI